MILNKKQSQSQKVISTIFDIYCNCSNIISNYPSFPYSRAPAAHGAVPPGDPPEPDQGAHRRGQDRLPRPPQVHQGVPRVQGQEAGDQLSLGDLRQRQPRQELM